MADDTFMGPDDEARQKEKAEALSKRGPSKISVELTAKRQRIEKEAEKRKSIAGLIIFFLIAIPLGMVIAAIFVVESMLLLKWGIVLLFTLSPAFLIIKAIFRKSTF